jgi:hypothetical protein
MSDMSSQDSTPPPDLSKEREEVLRSFRRSAALTERFMDQYSQMRERLLEVERENQMLRGRLAQDGSAPSSSGTKTPGERAGSQESSSTQPDDSRVLELEEEFAHLASLFVAGTQLLASLTTRGVLRRLRDILGQLIGVRAYTLYFLSNDGLRLVPIASDAVPSERLGAVSVIDSSLGRVLTGLTAKIDEDRDANDLSFDAPPALIPLVAGDRPVGLIVIYGLLPQKARFTRTDFELFRLLGQHAAPALIGASLFEQGGHRLPGAEVIDGISL